LIFEPPRGFERSEAFEINPLMVSLSNHWNVWNVARIVNGGSGAHRFFLEGPFHGQKAPSKLLNDAVYAYLTLIDQAVGGVRPAAPIWLVLTSKNFSRSFFIDVFPRADSHDFDVACSEPIDDSSSSHSQTPISFKLLFECLSASWIFKNICQSRAHLAF
jgi:hypothetical protein